MSSSALSAGLRHLRGKLAVYERQEESDEQLLHAFTSRRDDNAFAVLVHRHGPMVLHVCRRVLGHDQDAEDAFQAAFLVLAQSAAALRNKTALASFLHGIAYRTAMKAKVSAARRRKHEGAIEELTQQRSPVDPADELSWREVRLLLDEEIDRLPEKYRSVFVPCCLEELGRAEAAQRLGLKECTVFSRLAEARKRLARHLARRGVELPALLAATTLTSLPVDLTASTIKAASAAAAGKGLAGIVSASVIELMEAGGAGIFVSKAKMVTMILLAAAMLGGAGLWFAEPGMEKEPGERRGVSPPVGTSTGGLTPRRSPEASAPFVLRGRVLGPDNKPVAGAKLYSPRWSKERQKKQSDVAVVQHCITDKNGRFNLKLSHNEIHSEGDVSLVAAADGFGLAWVEVPPKEEAAELTLRLVEDVPIRGRLLTTEGKPMADVTVSVAGILAFERLDDFLRAFQRDLRHAVEEMGARRLLFPLNSVLSVKPTDKDGRFEIRGIGVERIAGLEMNSAAGVEGVMLAVTRDGFDAKAYLKSLLREPRERVSPHLFSPSFEHIVQREEANRIIEGTVREAGSGKPVAGATVTINGATAASDASMVGLALLLGRRLSEDDFGVITAVTDDRGHYRIMAKRKESKYWLQIRAPDDLPLIEFGVVVNAPAVSAGGSIRADVEMRRGGVVTGRVYDKATDKGVPSKVNFEPLPENKSDGLDVYKKRNALGAETGADGRFRLVAIPGAGVLRVHVADSLLKTDGVRIDPYKEAEFDAVDRRRIQMTDPSDPHRGVLTVAGVLYLQGQHACKVLDVKEGGAVSCDLTLVPVKTLTVQLQDAEGKPLSGAAVIGVSEHSRGMAPLKSAACKIYGLDIAKPRPVVFLHAERKLAALVKLRGDEKEPMTVRLAPGGVLTRRVFDGDGQPVTGAEVLVYYAMSESHYEWGALIRDFLPRTDKEGRFRLEGIVPGIKVNLGFLKGKRLPLPPLNIGPLQSGQTLDVGHIRVKPRRP